MQADQISCLKKHHLVRFFVSPIPQQKNCDAKCDALIKKNRPIGRGYITCHFGRCFLPRTFASDILFHQI